MRSSRPRIGAEVEIHANNSSYRGTLLSMSETEVYIKSASRTWSIATDRIQSLRYLDDKKSNSPRL